MTDLTLSSNASPTLNRNKAFPNPAHGGSTPLAAQQSATKILNNNKQPQKQSSTIDHNKTINSAWYGLEGESTRKKTLRFPAFYCSWRQLTNIMKQSTAIYNNNKNQHPFSQTIDNQNNHHWLYLLILRAKMFP